MPAPYRLGISNAVMQFERQCIARALDEHEGNVTLAAKALRTSRQTLQRPGVRPVHKDSGDRVRRARLAFRYEPSGAGHETC